MGSSKEGVICDLALSHRGSVTEQDGEVAQDAHGIPTCVYVDHVCAQHQCLNQIRHDMR